MQHYSSRMGLDRGGYVEARFGFLVGDRAEEVRLDSGVIGTSFGSNWSPSP